MVIVRLAGGLGNQMFEYAAARRLAVAKGVPLKLDLDWFYNTPARDTKRHYELGVFNCIQDIASPEEVRALRGVDWRRWPRVMKPLLCMPPLAKRTHLIEKSFRFDPAMLDAPGEAYLEGYWQSPKYFADAAETIAEEFTLKTPPDPLNLRIAEEIKGCEAVSLHVRRGDYVSNPAASQHHVTSPLTYYQAAIDRITSQLEKPHFFVFSDEPQWAKANLRCAAPLTCLEHNDPNRGYEDLRLMSLCRHHIIANSSFSWWGAWLGRHPGKMVIAPNRWFARDDIDTGDLIPQGWLRL